MPVTPQTDTSGHTIVPSIALLIMDGFEEAEALVIIDVLRRLKIDVSIVACQSEPDVVSYHKVRLIADTTLDAVADRLFDAVVLPGGPQGARALGKNAAVINFVRRHDEAHMLVCAICSAGAHVLAANGLLHGRRYVCSGENHRLYEDGQYVDEDIVAAWDSRSSSPSMSVPGCRMPKWPHCKPVTSIPG